MLKFEKDAEPESAGAYELHHLGRVVVQTRLDHFEVSTKYYLQAKRQVLLLKKWTQTWPNDANFPPVRSRTPQLNQGSCGQLTFSLGLCRFGWIAAHDVIFTKLKGQLYTLRFPKLTLIQSGKG